MAKQQKNFRLSDECCEALKLKTLQFIADGHKITETEVVEMAILHYCSTGAPAIQPGTKVYSSGAELYVRGVKNGEDQPERIAGTKKQSKKEQAIEQRASSDLVAQVVERDDIDYSDIDSTPTTHIAHLGNQPAPKVIATKSMATWRAGRKPLMKPKERR